MQHFCRFAEFRRFEEAIELLTGADRLVQEPAATMRFSPAYTWYFLAMAHHQLGNKNAAKEWLDKAVGWTEKVLREHQEGTSASAARPWNRRLTLRLLRDEAKTVLGLQDEAEESE